VSGRPVPAALPASRRPDPRSAPVLRWGVLGTGWVARRFVASLRAFTDQRVVAVGSRSRATARRFALDHGIATAHGGAEALAADPGVDVVYVATPHAAHRAGALTAIEAGKHVLVEKPLGLDAAEAEELLAAAAARRVLCVEAMWTMFLPRFDVVRQVLADGLLGDVRTVLADHGERFDPPHRILDPAMAGGALLDLGVYCTALATWVLGPATRVLASGEATPGGVTGQASILLEHAGNAQAALHTTILGRTPTTAVVAGTEATLTLPGPFMMPGPVVLTSADGRRSVSWADTGPARHDALYHQAVEVALRVAAGDTGTPLRPGRDVVAALAALDATRERLGVSFADVAR
jgi:predicted dehydrogenase